MLADTPLAYLDTLNALVERGIGDYLNRVRGWITDPDQAIFVAADGERLVGHLRAFDEGGRTGLVMVYVTPAWRGRGVLDGLVDAASRWSGGQGRSQLALAVMQDNHRAIRAYEKLGFAATGVTFPHPHLPIFIEKEMARLDRPA
jgi:GNAT superfamily N-acetyltransferase